MRGRKNADVVLTATTYAGRATDSVRIVIGEGACNADIYGAVTDAVFKNITLYKLADVGGDGSVTVTAAEAADNNLQQGY